MLEGSRITEFVIWPTRGRWGYVRWDGPVSAAALGAPYLGDLLIFGVFFWLSMVVSYKRRWVWINILAVGILSPFLNSLYNYWGSFRKPNDVSVLLQLLPENIVHGYFWLTISIYLAGFFVAVNFSRTVRSDIGREDIPL